MGYLCGFFISISLLLLALGHLGALTNLDLAAAQLAYPGAGPFLDAAFPFFATLWSPEASLLLGASAALLLWTAGLRRWAPAPLAFLLLVPMEIVMKAGFPRPPMPPLLKNWPSYALVKTQLADGFFSGSALRSGFLCLFVAIVLWQQGGVLARPAAAVVATVGVGTAIFRVYGGYHWLSSELAGQAMGAGLALLLAPVVMGRLRATRRNIP